MLDNLVDLTINIPCTPIKQTIRKTHKMGTFSYLSVLLYGFNFPKLLFTILRLLEIILVINEECPAISAHLGSDEMPTELHRDSFQMSAEC